MSLFSLIAYLITFNPDNKLHFLIYVLTRVSISTFPSLSFCMFIEEDGTNINNEDRKKIK